MKGIKLVGKEKECEIALNKLAREQTKYKLLKDIKFDLQVCELTGINPKEYLLELKEIIDEFLSKFERS